MTQPSARGWRRGRENLARQESERWRPPIFVPERGWRGRAMGAVRRFFDLQAASLWRDLVPLLGGRTGVVVDVGCGAQPYRRLLGASAVYVGLDTESASADFGYELPDVRRIEPDGAWPVRDGEADLVLATETLEHVPDSDGFLTEAARCLRPGGELVLTVPFAARWHYVPHDYWRFTPSGLRMLLEQAGFEEIVVVARGDERTVACYKLLALLLPAALPQDEGHEQRITASTILLAPFAVLLAGLAQLSLRGPGGDDCLGYTVTAVRGAALN